MTNFKIKDFNKIITSEAIEPRDAEGSYKDATTNIFTTTSPVYVCNLFTELLTKISGFYFNFWPDYTYTWIDKNLPIPVLEHMHNHYRAAGIIILSRESSSIKTFKRILNIALGYPFSIYDGYCTITNDGDFYNIVQTIDSVSTITYKISTNYSLLIQDGDYLTRYQELVSGITYNDLKDSDWFSTFDTYNEIPLVDVNNIDFALNKNRIVAITAEKYFGYNVNFLENTLKRIISNDIIFFFKHPEQGGAT